VPVEIDIATGEGRRLRSRGHRDYSARSPRALAGTADHVFWPADGALTVRDWKTGRQAGLAHEAARMQVRTLGVAMAAIYDVEEIAVEVAAISGAGVEVEREELDGAALEEHIDTLRVLAVKLTGGPTRPQPGPWCMEMFCPLFGECPSSRGALAAVTREQPIVDIEDDADAARMIEFLPRARAALEAAEAALRERIARQPVRGADGRLYGLVEHKRREVRITHPGHLAPIGEILGAFGPAAVEQRIVTKATLDSIRRAARRKLTAEGRKRGVEQVTEQVFAALQAAGGASERSYWQPGWFWPEGEGPAALPEATDASDYEG
jgi:hypothetical protein